MIAAGLVDDEDRRRVRWRERRPGICFFRPRRSSSPGSVANAGGRRRRRPRPLGRGAVSQPPLFRGTTALVGVSLNTSQLVLTANESIVPATGASTGSPSNTTRLAGRSLKIAAARCRVELRGRWVELRRLSKTVASGTRLLPAGERLGCAPRLRRLRGVDGKRAQRASVGEDDGALRELGARIERDVDDAEGRGLGAGGCYADGDARVERAVLRATRSSVAGRWSRCLWRLPLCAASWRDSLRHRCGRRWGRRCRRLGRSRLLSRTQCLLACRGRFRGVLPAGMQALLRRRSVRLPQLAM